MRCVLARAFKDPVVLPVPLPVRDVLPVAVIVVRAGAVEIDELADIGLVLTGRADRGRESVLDENLDKRIEGVRCPFVVRHPELDLIVARSVEAVINVLPGLVECPVIVPVPLIELNVPAVGVVRPVILEEDGIAHGRLVGVRLGVRDRVEVLDGNGNLERFVERIGPTLIVGDPQHDGIDAGLSESMLHYRA